MGIGLDVMNGLIAAVAGDPVLAVAELTAAVTRGQDALVAIAQGKDDAKAAFTESKPIEFAPVETAAIVARLADIGKPRADPFAVVPVAFEPKAP